MVLPRVSGQECIQKKSKKEAKATVLLGGNLQRVVRRDELVVSCRGISLT